MSRTGTTAAELLRVLVHKKTRLPAEIGTFVVLEGCERLLDVGPLAVSLESIWVAEDGSVSLLSAPIVDEASSARALHRGLASLLVASGPMLTPTLMRLVEEGPRGGQWSLRQLRDDLEATLVPLNRNASRRVLARFVRETRDASAGDVGLGRSPGFQDLDSELSALLSGGLAVPDISSRELDATVREPIEEVGMERGEVHFFDSAQETSGHSAPQGAFPGPAPRTTPMSAAPLPLKVSRPQAKARALHQSTLPPGASKRPPAGRGLGLALLFVALALGLCALTFVLRPQAFDRLLGREVVSVVQAPKAPPASPALPRAGDLRIRVSPERAQVLRFIGRGPVSLPHVPQGLAQEFVATMDDSMPTRVVLPADAEWEKAAPTAASTHELAMQLRPKQPSDVPLDLGDSLLPSNLGQSRGEAGTVRIVTTPKGAKVYQLVGFAPEARIENIALTDAQELLIFRKGYIPQIKVVAPSDFVPDANGRPTADISVQLMPIAKPSR